MSDFAKNYLSELATVIQNIDPEPLERVIQCMREARDKDLAAPLLLLPSIQTNIRAGRFPEAEANGVHYLKIPVKPAGNTQLI